MPLRAPTLRPLAFPHVSLIPPQKRWARVRDIRFVTQQASERVTDRYRDKLEQKRKQLGAEDLDDLKTKYKEKIETLRKKTSGPGATGGAEAWPSPPPAPAPQPQGQTPPTQVPKDFGKGAGIKTLESFMDVEKVAGLPQKEVEALWRLRHASNPASLCATVPRETWTNVYKTARKHPIFILPGLPRTPSGDQAEDAAPIHLLQWTFPSPTTATVIFTHLAEYKLRGEYAQPHTTLTHHVDLTDSHGLVLCEGSVIDGRGVSLEEGKWLVMNMQKFYNIGEEVERNESSEVGKQLKQRRRSLVEKFSSGSADFKVEDLLEEAERMG